MKYTPDLVAPMVRRLVTCQLLINTVTNSSEMKGMERLVKCAIFTGHQGTEIDRNTSTIKASFIIDFFISWLIISKRVLEGVIAVVVKTQTVLQNIPQLVP